MSVKLLECLLILWHSQKHNSPIKETICQGCEGATLHTPCITVQSKDRTQKEKTLPVSRGSTRQTLEANIIFILSSCKECNIRRDNVRAGKDIWTIDSRSHASNANIKGLLTYQLASNCSPS